MSEHLYIHVPFCLRKCRYCDFFSQEDISKIPEYVSALIKEIQLRADQAENTGATPCADTIYFGGGTPSVLPLTSLETILGALHQYYGICPGAEITLEANPGTLDDAYLLGLARLGINRLSIGVQSFEDNKLGFLGRIHTGNQAIQAVESARSAGFDNIGLDLIYGLPEENQSHWKKEMDAALAVGPEHLSCYMLTLEPGTPLYTLYESNGFSPMAGENLIDLFSFTSEYLEASGFYHYEISNFARGKANQSRHNSAYWKMVPYTGFGPSAHSYWIQSRKGEEDIHVRAWNPSDLDAYCRDLGGNRLPGGEEEAITPAQQMAEQVMVGLRTKEGLDIEGFDRLSRVSFQQEYKELISEIEAEKLGYIAGDGKRFILTRAGWARLDSIVESFAEKIL